MRYTIFLLIIGILFTRFLPLSLPMTIVIALTWLFGARYGLLAALILGIAEDIYFVRLLGESSLVLFLMVVVTAITSRQLEVVSGVFVFISGLVAGLVVQLWWREDISMGILLMYGGLTWLFWWIRQLVHTSSGVYLKP